MGGNGGQTDIQYAPLMSRLQMEFLDQMIRGTRGQLQDLPLGIPYGGPSVSSYSPRAFELSGGFSGYPSRSASGATAAVAPAAASSTRGPREPRRGPRAGPPEGPRARNGPAGRVREAGEGTKAEKTALTQPVTWGDLLGTGGYAGGAGGTGGYGEGYTSPYTKAITNPWFNFLSGNFPRQRA